MNHPFLSFKLFTHNNFNSKEDFYEAIVDPGVVMAFEDGSNFLIENGAELLMLGTPENEITVTHEATGYYGFQVDGIIASSNVHYRYMNTDGIHVSSSGIIDPSNNFSKCEFSDGEPGGCMLKVNNSQDFRIGNLGPVRNTIWHLGSSDNVSKTVDQGYVQLVAFSGSMAGESYDDDSYNRVIWGDSTLTPTPSPTPTGPVQIPALSPIGSGFLLMIIGTLLWMSSLTTRKL